VNSRAWENWTEISDCAPDAPEGVSHGLNVAAQWRLCKGGAQITSILNRGHP
jgi:hypothetical protein